MGDLPLCLTPSPPPLMMLSATSGEVAPRLSPADHAVAAGFPGNDPLGSHLLLVDFARIPVAAILARFNLSQRSGGMRNGMC